jgi:dolichol-phosphate mannosyltransferase
VSDLRSSPAFTQHQWTIAGAARDRGGLRMAAPPGALGIRAPTLLVYAHAAMRPVWLIIPTFNEAETLGPLAHAAAKRLQETAGDQWRILVVDDASPDGTGKLADRLTEEIPQLEVLHRSGKAGLGRAYLAGFARALEGGAGVIVQMDADFSHDPASIPVLLAALEDADMVLGSRYVRGGAVEDWGWVRRFISRGGCVYAGRVLDAPIQDMTGGYKAHRRHALEAIDLPSIRSEGYSFQIEVTYRALRSGLRVTECPIVFRDRRLGKSKMSPRIALEAAWLVPRLRGWRPRTTVAPAPPAEAAPSSASRAG